MNDCRPFDGTNTTCFLAQFYNAVYVMNADASDATAVYIYDANGKSWSKQSVTAPSGTHTFDPTNFKAILDHDTNVFCAPYLNCTFIYFAYGNIDAMSKGEMFFLDMGSLTAANSSALSWTDVGAPSAWGDLSAYSPTMALAQNHIHFIDVPGLSSGQADIFVIHFSFFQPEAQGYGSFPESHGQAVSFFQTSDVQQEFAYVPDDGSATYVINVENNSTQTLAAPDVKDAGAQYFAGITSLVQLSAAQGSLQFLPYKEGSDNSGASWTKITSVTIPAGSDSSSSNSSSGANSTASGGSATHTASGSGSSASSGTTSGAEKRSGVVGVLGSMLGAVALGAVLL